MKEFNAEELFALSDPELKGYLAGWAVEDIERAMMVCQNHVDELNRKRGLMAEVYNQKLSLAEAGRKVALMSDDEKTALVQAIQTQGVSGQRPVGDQ